MVSKGCHELKISNPKYLFLLIYIYVYNMYIIFRQNILSPDLTGLHYALLYSQTTLVYGAPFHILTLPYMGNGWFHKLLSHSGT